MIDKCSANISFMFADRPFLDRIDAAKAAGLNFVECHFPYEFTIEALKERLARASVCLTGLNTAPGDTAKGEWGLAAVPGREKDFEAHFDQALEYAVALGSSVIHVMAGNVPYDERSLSTYVANLRDAARKASSTNVNLILEPLNRRDMPRYFIAKSDDIVEVLKMIDRPNVKLLFDVYHVQIMEGDLTKRLERHQQYIGHVQIAAVPSRAEPDEGEVNLAAIFKALDVIGYRGFVGLEYKPRARTEDGLKWLSAYR
jgi:2-dehydrotetronate isomerase